MAKTLTNDGFMSIDIDDNLLSLKVQRMLKKLNDPGLRTDINKYIGTQLNQYVPQGDGRNHSSGKSLRDSMEADEFGISWSTPYAHYQFEGVVYEPNMIGFDAGGNVIWRSKKGSTKSPTNRELGTPGVAVLTPQFGQQYVSDVEDIYWEFGYTTPGTRSHWDQLYTTVGGDQESRSFRRAVNLQISNMVKRALKGV